MTNFLLCAVLGQAQTAQTSEKIIQMFGAGMAADEAQPLGRGTDRRC